MTCGTAAPTSQKCQGKSRFLGDDPSASAAADLSCGGGRFGHVSPLAENECEQSSDDRTYGCGNERMPKNN